MITLEQAETIAIKAIPDGVIQEVKESPKFFSFVIYQDDPYEGKMDPFYSVNKETGEFLGMTLSDAFLYLFDDDS